MKMKKQLLLLTALAMMLTGCSSAPAETEAGAKAGTKDGTAAVDSSQETGTKETAGGSAVGTFEGEAFGHGGILKVSVTVDETGITGIQVVEHQETKGVGYGMEETPIETVPAAIVANQSIRVDTVAGATMTSNAVIGAVKAALENGGVDVAAYEKEVAPAVTVQDSYDVDVVVVGGGAAGLSAAIAAADEGASVLLLEKEGITGGSTTVSGGKVLAAGTEQQKAAGIEDSADALYEYMMSLGNDDADPEVVRTLCDKSADAIDFLEENHVVFADVERTHASLPVWRVHNTEGGAWMISGIGGSIIVPMTASAKDKGVQFLFNTPATELIVTDGGITGVKAKHGDTEITVNAKSVILACGGYACNQELMEEAQTAAGLEPVFVTTAGVGNTGDGILMAAAVGAETNTTAGASYTYLDFNSGTGVNEENGLILSKDGERVCNEFSYQYVWTANLVDHQSSNAFYVTDAEEPNAAVLYAMTLDSTLKADSVKDLAALMQVDPETLQDSISRYNASCQKGEDEEFGKPAEYLNELTGTLYAIPMTRSYSFTFGGIRINQNAEVLDTDGNVIPHLYAAGEAAFYSLLGTEPTISYPSCGTAIGSGVVFGRIAGENAVK